MLNIHNILETNWRIFLKKINYVKTYVELLRINDGEKNEEDDGRRIQ